MKDRPTEAKAAMDHAQCRMRKGSQYDAQGMEDRWYDAWGMKDRCSEAGSTKDRQEGEAGGTKDSSCRCPRCEGSYTGAARGAQDRMGWRPRCDGLKSVMPKVRWISDKCSRKFVGPMKRQKPSRKDAKVSLLDVQCLEAWSIPKQNAKNFAATGAWNSCAARCRKVQRFDAESQKFRGPMPKKVQRTRFDAESSLLDGDSSMARRRKFHSLMPKGSVVWCRKFRS